VTPAILAAAPLIPPTSTILSRLSEAWGYVVLAVSTIFTEELAPVVGGFAAEQGHVSLVGVMVACAAGVWALSLGSYAIGHWNAAWVRLYVRRSWKTVGRLLGSMRARPWRVSIMSRFAFAARIAFSMACGAAHVPFGVYAAGTAIGAIVWSVALTILGWFFGEGAVLLLGHVRRYEDRIAALLVVAGLIVYLVIRRRRARTEQRGAP
jgi:membrane protein DedA with SNARE-associated domain